MEQWGWEFEALQWFPKREFLGKAPGARREEAEECPRLECSVGHNGSCAAFPKGFWDVPWGTILCASSASQVEPLEMGPASSPRECRRGRPWVGSSQCGAVPVPLGSTWIQASSKAASASFPSVAFLVPLCSPRASGKHWERAGMSHGMPECFRLGIPDPLPSHQALGAPGQGDPSRQGRGWSRITRQREGREGGEVPYPSPYPSPYPGSTHPMSHHPHREELPPIPSQSPPLKPFSQWI